MAEKVARLQEDVHKRISQKKLDLGIVSISDTIGVCLDLLEQIENIVDNCDGDDSANMTAMSEIYALFNGNIHEKSKSN